MIMTTLFQAIALPLLAVLGYSLSSQAPFGVAALFVILVIGFLCFRSAYFLGSDEQLRVEYFTGAAVHNGPGVVCLIPLTYRSAPTVKTATSLGTMDYVIVKDTATGEERAECGPQLLFLAVHDVVKTWGEGVCLNETEYMRVENSMTGHKEVLEGPRVWFPGPFTKGQKGSATSLSRTDYVIVDDKLSGEQKLVKGPCVWFPGPHEVASPKNSAIALRDDEYVRLKDTFTGCHWIKTGQALVFLEPNWKIEGGGVKKAWVLKANQYLRLLDVNTGKVTVHRGEAKVFPGPHEELLDQGPQQAVEIDGEHAVLVRDKSTGKQRLVTEEQLFVPGPSETIEEVRELIKLAEHEAMILKDKDGVFSYKYGSDAKRAPGEPRSFFLPPGFEIVKVWWSRGPRRERKDVSFERFDCRPHFMKFEFNCRTADNVELVLEGVIFWELIDLPAMFRHTGDTSGDMVYHMRSQFILHVAKVTLRTFMEQLHTISQSVLDEDVSFYEKRGIKVYSLEVSRYQCANTSTAEILEQIIQETTNRMNRLSQAEGENEVNLFRTQGQVEQAKLNKDLQEIQREEAQAEAKVAGMAEADRVASFLEGLEVRVPQLTDRIAIWQTLRKTEALSVVSSGGANLYFTPSDVDLSIETKPSAGTPQQSA